MIKLKPCPFCGGEAEVIMGDLWRNYKVGCRNIKCPIFPRTHSYLTKEEAIKTWNTRADDAYSDDGK